MLNKDSFANFRFTKRGRTLASPMTVGSDLFKQAKTSSLSRNLELKSNLHMSSTRGNGFDVTGYSSPFVNNKQFLMTGINSLNTNTAKNSDYLAIVENPLGQQLHQTSSHWP
jgi:hypothetical protein